VKEITVQEFVKWKKVGKKFELIDVREAYEKKISDIGGVLMPLATVIEASVDIKKDKPVLCYCHSGTRSYTAASFMEEHLGFTETYSLKGGISAYRNEIDPSLEEY